MGSVGGPLVALLKLLGPLLGKPCALVQNFFELSKILGTSLGELWELSGDLGELWGTLLGRPWGGLSKLCGDPKDKALLGKNNFSNM